MDSKINFLQTDILDTNIEKDVGDVYRIIFDTDTGYATLKMTKDDLIELHRGLDTYLREDGEDEKEIIELTN